MDLQELIALMAAAIYVRSPGHPEPGADFLRYAFDLAFFVKSLTIFQFIETVSKKGIYSIRIPVQMIPEVITIATE